LAVFPLVRAGWWAWEELNLRLHPYQQSSAYRYATLRFRRWCATVKGQVMRSKIPARPAHGQDAAAAGRVGDQLVAGKVMGLPGGAAAPSSGVTVTVTVVKPRGRPGPYGFARLVASRNAGQLAGSGE
jgi:hypothetical protein